MLARPCEAVADVLASQQRQRARLDVRLASGGGVHRALSGGTSLRLAEHHPQRTGYLLKDRLSDIAVLVDGLRRIVAGDVVIDPTLVARMVGRQREVDVLARLSARERDVLALVAQGLTNEAIGRRLFIGDRTVESHVTSAMHKLAIDTTAVRGTGGSLPS
jgi:DNA-binding CsgD family transcriptional regulator